MKRKIALILCILLCTVSVGCDKNANKDKMDTSPEVQQTETPDGGKVVTDQTEVQAMAGAIVEKINLEFV